MSKRTNLQTWLVMSVFLLAVGIGTSSVFATGNYDDGDGSPGNPFQINTAAQMDEIGQHSEDWGLCFVLTADIDLSGYTGTAFHIIGNYSNRFTGVFDGDDHTISNFTYTSTGTSYIGLFGYVEGANAEIKDLGLLNVSVDVGWRWYVGGLVGYNLGGTISNCYSVGDVSGNEKVGGLVGKNDEGTISNCYATGDVTGTGDWDVGGLVGFNSGTISNCYATGTVTATGNYSLSVGGLVGYNAGTTSNCYATGTVSGRSWVGGLVGWNYGTISDCYAAGTVTGSGTVGGLVGYYSYGTVSNCYATGPVTGGWYAGGLVGYNSDGTISSCYACGVVSGTTNVGGLVGNDSRGSYTSCFWDIDVNPLLTGVGNTTDPTGVMARTTAQMQTMSTYFGWGCEPAVWTIDDGSDSPHLVWENQPGQQISPLLSDLLDGSGTAQDPYLIYTDQQLNLIGLFSCEWDKHFLLMADIDLSGWSPTEPNIIAVFTGVFNGNGHSISNFTYQDAEGYYIGLFRRVDGPNAEIKNLTLIAPNVEGESSVGSLVGRLGYGTITGCSAEGGSVTGDYSYVGGLVGLNGGTVSNCYAAGTVTGSSYVGGLAGYNLDGTVSNCYATGAVTGGGLVGGLVGINYSGTVSNCYATGTVTGGSDIGGLVGGNDGTVSNSYATGDVTGDDYVGGLVGENGYGGTISNCYATGTVTATGNYGYYVGGLVGFNNGGTISNCDAAGTVTGTDDDVGGLVGFNSGTVSNSYAIGDVTGDDYVGGLVGENGYGGTISNCYATGDVTGGGAVGGLVGSNFLDGTVSNCYATGSVTGDYFVGGLVGYNDFGSVSYCYAAGTVTGDDMVGGLMGHNFTGTITNCYACGVVSGTTNVGGLVGYHYSGSYTACFWDINVNPSLTGVGNIADPTRVMARTTAQMQTQSTFTDYGWDFVGDSLPSDDWGMPDGGGYPILWWQLDPLPELPSFSGGSGTANDPYIIADANDLSSIGHNYRLMDKHFLVVNNIDLADVDFFVISSEWYPFTGVLDGNGRTISNFTGTSYIGLFGSVYGAEAEIRDLGLIDVNVDAGTGRYVGGLVGHNYEGTISNCYATGTVSGGKYVGGLVGWNRGTVSNCYATGNVTGTAGSVGGLVGYNRGTVSNCFAAGEVSGDDLVGGLVGSNHSGTVSNCFATGTVTATGNLVGGLVGSNHFGTVSNCYAAGDVTGDDYVGGLVGSNSSGTVSNCYATGDVNGNDRVGGLVGYNSDGTISNCYACGVVSGTNNVGGLVGNDSRGSYTSCFWDIDVNPLLTGVGNITDPPDVMGRTTPEMQMESTFTDASWDFTTPIWKMCDEPDYPRLAWECPVPPIEVAMKFTPQALNLKSKGKWLKAHFVLPDGFDVNDVDANTPAVIAPLGIESDHINVFINEDELVEIEAAFDRADFCSNGPTEGTVTVVGLLSSGQNFYGTDTIRIITTGPKYLAAFASHWLDTDCGKPDWCSGADLDQDSVVNFVDFAMFDPPEACCIEFIK